MRLDPATVPAEVANRVLAREQWARDCLAAHGGRAFKVIIGPFISTMQIDGSGTIESVAALDRAADLSLTISPFAMPAFLADPKRWDEFVREEGDAALAVTLKGLAETLPWFVERAFAQALGPVAGRFIADTGRRMLAFPDYAGARMGDSLASYIRDEAALAVTSSQAGGFSDEVAETAARVEALAQRVGALAERLSAKHTGNQTGLADPQ
jgi:ubiquinone biosynthesis protein UbiJ